MQYITGWGDFFATLIRMHKSKPVDFTMGEWASGVKGGIRKYKVRNRLGTIYL
jgi:extracellular elastinolytic metalloproteinase